MQVSTAVHESVLDQVHAGLKAIIRVDAFPERSYAGTVKSVAVLPDQGGWFSSDTKVYQTVVTIDEKVKQLKPGMTAVVEIDVEKLPSVLSVPIQAIVQRGSSNWCYVKAQSDLQRREIRLGKTNDKFVEIVEGISEGEVVVLNPMSLVEEEAAENKEKEKQAEREEGEAAGEDALEDQPTMTEPISARDAENRGPGPGAVGGGQPASGGGAKKPFAGRPGGMTGKQMRRPPGNEAGSSPTAEKGQQ
jgi:hypothetical protein